MRNLNDSLALKATGQNFTLLFNEQYGQFAFRRSGTAYVRNGVKYVTIQAVMPISGQLYIQGIREGGTNWETLS